MGAGAGDAAAWDVAVIGAGPAGSLAAYCAARAGLRVVLFEKEMFPRYKVCGCCVNGAALACLKAAGLGDLTAQLQAPRLTVYALAADRLSARMTLPAGVAVSRSAFDAALAEQAVAAGAVFRPGCRVELGWIGAAAGSVKTASSAGTTDAGAGLAGARMLQVRTSAGIETVAARVVLAASGLGALAEMSAAASHRVDGETTGVAETAGAAGEGHRDAEIAEAARGSYIGAGRIAPAMAVPAFYATGCVFMSCGAQGYVGWVRLEDGRMNFAAALDPIQVKRLGGLNACVQALWAEALPADWPQPLTASDMSCSGGWRGTPLLTRESSLWAAERLFVLGDQAGYVEPFTGEGIAWALESALRVMPFVMAACHANAEAPWQAAWTAAWSSKQQSWRVPRQRLCRWVAGSLRHPRLIHAAVRVLGGFPHLADPLLMRLNATPSNLDGG